MVTFPAMLLVGAHIFAGDMLPCELLQQIYSSEVHNVNVSYIISNYKTNNLSPGFVLQSKSSSLYIIHFEGITWQDGN